MIQICSYYTVQTYNAVITCVWLCLFNIIKLKTCADPESFVKGGHTLTIVF